MLTFLLTLAWAAPPATGHLTGTIVDEEGIPVLGIHVVATADPPHSFETRADTEGRYRFEALPVGSYELSFIHRGFEPIRVSGAVVAADQETAVLLELRLEEDYSCSLCLIRLPVDVTSGDRGSTLRQESLSRLPLGRSYQSAAASGLGATSTATEWVHCGL